MNWQPIDTAPIGKKVLVYWPHNHGIPLVAWLNYNEEWVYPQQGYNGCVPTHWMPLPEPPKDERG